ncbi:hypothetical protein EV121DRAFT_251248 [Schizophyllum commune]
MYPTATDALNDLLRTIHGSLLRTHRDAAEVTPEYKSFLSDSIRDMKAEIQRIDAELSQIDTTHRIYNRSYDTACSLEKRYPRCLPEPILSRIFTLALPGGWESHCAGRVTLPFAQVCHLWRSVALRTPSIWRHIKVQVEESPPRHWKEAVIAYLARSADAPLCISILLDTRDASSRQQRYISRAYVNDVFWDYEVWNMLCAHAHRWEYARLEALPMIAYSVTPLLPFRKLTTIILRLTRVYAPPEADECFVPTSFFAEATSVHSVTIGYVMQPSLLVLPPSWRPARLSIWAGCRRGLMGTAFQDNFHPRYEPDTPCPTLAPSFPAVLLSRLWLQELELSVGTLPVMDLPVNLDGTEFPVLRKLALFDDACEVARYIVAPRLEEVEIDADGTYMGCTHGYTYYPHIFSHPLQSLARLLSRPGGCTRLRSMRISPQMDESARDLFVCLESAPTLVELVLDAMDNEEFPDEVVGFDVIEALTRKDDNEHSLSFLPNLVALTLHVEMCMTFANMTEMYSPAPLCAAVWRMLASRRVERVHHGRVLRPLRAFSSCADGRESFKGHWPLPEHRYGEAQPLMTVSGDVVWAEGAEEEMAEVLKREAEWNVFLDSATDSSEYSTAEEDGN